MRKLNQFFTAVLLIALTTSFTYRTDGGAYTIDTAASSLKWTGYHLAKSYEHWGNISLISGTIELEGDDIVSGEFTLDMNSITNGDLDDDKSNQKLVKDLKSERFFNAKGFPTASLKIKSAERSGSKYAVTADITIRNITKEIQFEASKSEKSENLTFSAEMMIDRIPHEVMHGWSVENAMLSNEFKMEVNLVVKK